jgi:hypothetical protein
MVPACSFALIAVRFARPFGPRLHHRTRFAPFPAVSQPQTRCALRNRLTRPLFLSPLPSRSFSLPRDQSVQQTSLPPGPPSASARSPLTPRSPIYLNSRDSGSSFAVRYVSGGSLFLKPLGTFPNMLLTGSFRQPIFRMLQHVFNRLLLSFYERVRWPKSAAPVDKTLPSHVVLRYLAE